ncbi:MAG: UDP-glucose/GDP-mannose dehydrogenase family protein [Holosporaceae bacterium]|jgi:UDPglucose 6-dehydrogenase|nr:UDP-glucose/GDP-mannose dehydrogenase family protein [Holosporaceae bacterium]
MKITVVGTGYVGLVSGVCFSEFGFDVTCIDNNKSKITDLQRGKVPIYEDDLERLMTKNMHAGRLFFTSDTGAGVKDADLVFIAVGTPSKSDGSADLSYIYGAVGDLAPHIRKDATLVIKSTVPVGTTRAIKNFLLKKGVDVEVAFNPEFLREGAAVADFLRPDRIILGVESIKAEKALARAYRPLYMLSIPILFTGLETAELSKYAANAFLAMKVTFINEIANLCEKCGADVQEVAHAIGLDKRIGELFLQAGPGYGGSCFPKDTCALSTFAKEFGVETPLVDETIKSNNERRSKMIKKIMDACHNDVKNKNVAVLGVTFKANTDDMRDSPSISIVDYLLKEGARVKIYDPSFSEQAKNIFKGVYWSTTVYDNCNDADIVVILTDWAEFRAVNLRELRRRVRNPLLVDLRNIYTVPEVKATGFVYHSVGRSLLNE